LISVYDTDLIFGNYAARRDAILRKLIDKQRVGGFWDDTVFPTLKHLVKYGADALI
jgi:hypothetical protein